MSDFRAYTLSSIPSWYKFKKNILKRIKINLYFSYIKEHVVDHPKEESVIFKI